MKNINGKFFGPGKKVPSFIVDSNENNNTPQGPGNPVNNPECILYLVTNFATAQRTVQYNDCANQPKTIVLASSQSVRLCGEITSGLVGTRVSASILGYC